MENNFYSHACYWSTSPREENNQSLDELITEIDNTSMAFKLIMGDFNYPIVQWTNLHSTSPNKEANELTKTILDCYMSQQVNFLARARGDSIPSCIDLVITNTDNIVNGMSRQSPLDNNYHVTWNVTSVYIPETRKASELQDIPTLDRKFFRSWLQTVNVCTVKNKEVPSTKDLKITRAGRTVPQTSKGVYRRDICITGNDIYTILEGRKNTWKMKERRKLSYLKKGSGRQAYYYIPVNLRNVICKIMESLTREDIMEHTRDNKLFNHSSMGLLPWGSKTTRRGPHGFYEGLR